MKQLWKFAFIMLTAFSLASCSSDEPRYADTEAHEKTVQLNEQYGSLLVGTWHIVKSGDTKRYFERLTFGADGTLTGERKWQTRLLVIIDDEERYTDWEDINGENGKFTGKWKLSWERDAEGASGTNRLWLTASYDGERDWISANAFSLNTLFISADETTLSFSGGYVRNGDNGETVYTRGEAEPSF